MIIEVPQRWVDLDAQGHVNNALVADYLQEARVGWLLSGQNAHLLGSSTMVVAHQIEYLGPLHFSIRPVEVELGVGALGASRFTLGYSVRQDGREVARARSIMCVFDHVAGRPRRMTTAERSWFAGQSGTWEPFAPLGDWQVGPQAHHHELRVRWSDQDSYGHVNNVRIFDYFAEARVRLHQQMPPDLTWLIARQDVDYLAQITLRREPYQVSTAIAGIGRTSARLVAQVEDPATGQRLARARTVLVSADLAGKPIPMPEPMHDLARDWPAV